MEMCTSSNLLVALQKAPALLALCSDAGGMRSLRAICKTARLLVNSSVRSLTIEIGNRTQQAHLIPLLQECRLSKLHVHGGDVVARHGKMLISSSTAGGCVAIQACLEVCSVHCENVHMHGLVHCRDPTPSSPSDLITFAVVTCVLPQDNSLSSPCDVYPLIPFTRGKVFV